MGHEFALLCSRTLILGLLCAQMVPWGGLSAFAYSFGNLHLLFISVRVRILFTRFVGKCFILIIIFIRGQGIVESFTDRAQRVAFELRPQMQKAETEV